MHPPTPHLPPHSRNIIQNLLPRPPQRVRHKQHIPLGILQNNPLAKQANLLERLILGPRPDGHLQIPLLNINKPRLLHRLALGLVLHDAEGLAHFLAAVDEDLAPLAEGRGLGYCAVVGLDESRHLVRLEPAAWLQGGEGAGVEERPVGGGSEQPAGVDVVEVGGGKGPLEVEVVDFELEVGGDPGWLGWGEVGAGYGGGGEFGCEVDCPDSFFAGEC